MASPSEVRGFLWSDTGWPQMRGSSVSSKAVASQGCEEPFIVPPEARYCSPERRAVSRPWRRNTSRQDRQSQNGGKNRRLKADGINVARQISTIDRPAYRRRNVVERCNRLDE